MDLVVKNRLSGHRIQVLYTEQYVFLDFVKPDASLFVAIIKVDEF